MSIKIESNVALPASVRGSRASKYPWAEMDKGDSFFVPDAKIETFYTLTASARKKYGVNFVARKWQEGDKNGVRVWRTED